MSENPYNYPDYKSPYVKTDYTGTFRMKNAETGKLEEVQTSRTVYRNTQWDPDLVIPAGTKIGNEKVLEKDTTNVERMQQGKPPVIASVNEQGEVVYDKIELHHLSGEEIQKGSQYFTGKSRDGTLVEVRASTHDEFSKQIHNLNEKNVSFRTEMVTSVDEDGNTIRTREKTEENSHYKHTRETYWKDRATEFQNDYVDVQAQTNSGESMASENDYVGISSEVSQEESSVESVDYSNGME